MMHGQKNFKPIYHLHRSTTSSVLCCVYRLLILDF